MYVHRRMFPRKLFRNFNAYDWTILTPSVLFMHYFVYIVSCIWMRRWLLLLLSLCFKSCLWEYETLIFFLPDQWIGMSFMHMSIYFSRQYQTELWYFPFFHSLYHRIVWEAQRLLIIIFRDKNSMRHIFSASNFILQCLLVDIALRIASFFKWCLYQKK